MPKQVLMSDTEIIAVGGRRRRSRAPVFDDMKERKKR